MATRSQTNDLNIKEADEIVAIEILKDTHDIDALKYTKKKIRHIQKLLNIAINSSKIKEE